MLETQITMDPGVAKEHYLAYRRLKESQRTKEDQEIQRSYLEISRGHAIINATEALELAGLDDDGNPRIAFCRASAERCFLRRFGDAVSFCDKMWPRDDYRSGLMRCAMPGSARHWGHRSAIVPMVPPAHRPGASLDRFWLMWEVEEGGWQGGVPVDPALLKRLNHTTFAVLAVWDLTDVERMVLQGRAQ